MSDVIEMDNGGSQRIAVLNSVRPMNPFFVSLFFLPFFLRCFRVICSGEWRGMFLQSDVILETVTYGGVVNSACHGVGQTQVGWSNVDGCVGERSINSGGRGLLLTTIE